MSSTREQTPPRRRRKRPEAGLSLDNPSKLQPSKRLKSSKSRHPATFYDSLSKVWLTRRSLKELDRRTSQISYPQRPASTLPQVCRGTLWKQVQRSARHGGPELCYLRGTQRQQTAGTISRSSRSRRTESTGSTSNSTSSNRNHLTTTTILSNTLPITGLTYITENRNQATWKVPRKSTTPRPSLSPSRFFDNAFENLQQKNYNVINEGEVMRLVVPIICGDAGIPSKQNLLFTKLQSITSGVTVKLQPDFYDGASLEAIDKRVREELGLFIIPTGRATAAIAPKIFLEARPPLSGAGVVKIENIAVYDGMAYTITSTYRDGMLKLYTTHPTRAEDDSPEYHMTQINAWALTGNPNNFREGATAF